MRVILLLILLTTSFIYSECVHEFTTTGSKITTMQRKAGYDYFVEIDGRFINIDKIKTLDLAQQYTIQEVHKFDDKYNEKYLTYYDCKRLNDYLKSMTPAFLNNGYKLDIIGQSIKKRDLFVVHPNALVPNKKTIVMFCRHHGDEGTANWIVEGFVNSIFKNRDLRWFEEYQLILYPMVNPDGTENRVRYNENSRDLNRVWNQGSSDEVGHIRRHLLPQLDIVKNNVIIVLDMHGSFTQDFIYRVPRSFSGSKFFDKQSRFINELSLFDRWQGGDYQISTGAPGMSRIFLIQKYQYNALTHESIRNIPKNNPEGRTVQSLKEQGEAIYKVLLSWKDK